MQTATVLWVEKEQFLATLPSGHTIPIDSDRKYNSAPGPMELLLAALGACTATDVVAILAKKRQKLERLEIVIHRRPRERTSGGLDKARSRLPAVRITR